MANCAPSPQCCLIPLDKILLQIAAELKHIRKHPYISVGADDAVAALEVEGPYDLGHLFRILKQVSKVDFSEYKPATIQRRILRRMALKKIDNLSLAKRGRAQRYRSG